ncbi:hypothetical protein [Litoreibacter roseus]|uniref:Uncharacterized protein n=1 Tax=Litoreibacter roseus TaxID=2601869 RepID=A0A6N6JD05_9RHOB|nr:hypothetical protein [Litoreibacter roseus]GFE63700.1 hypothetical protein KIN_07740 [Litoreibacter roseus]
MLTNTSRLLGRTFGLAAFLLSGPAFAQATAEGPPLSAIGWLSDTIAIPARLGPRELPDQTRAVTATSATPARINTVPLGQTNADAVGLLPRSVTGLPDDFWGNSSSAELARLIADLRADLPPPLADLLRQILLAELAPPVDSTRDAKLFLARVDRLLATGALNEARALLERAGPTDPRLFRRWFDVSLLSGQEDQACRQMLGIPEIAPTIPARVFCLARGGDWSTAVATLMAAETLKVISTSEADLLARFLDPELADGQAFLPAPDRVTPLSFFLHSAIGEPLAQGTLPRAFDFASLSETQGWKARLRAAERLSRLGAIAPSQLLAIYSERRAAASGGVWDRVAAVQALDRALSSGTDDEIVQSVATARDIMRTADLEPALARMFAPALIQARLKNRAADAALPMLLLSNAYEKTAIATPLRQSNPIWYGVALGDVQTNAPIADPLEASIAAAFNTDGVPLEFADLVEEGKLGEAVLRAIAMMQDGTGTDPKSLEYGIGLLRSLGFEDTARKMALHVLLTRDVS